MKRINVNLLIDKCHEIFMKAGIPEADAALLTDVLVTTDMRGVNSHGVMRSASYLDCINAGGIRAIAEPQVLSETPASFQVSAAGGLGIPAACKTMRRVIEKCSEQAVVCATVNHSDHYGAAGYYAMMGAEAGLLTFSMSNTCPLVAPTGGRAATIGNNPFAYAAPGERHHAVLFDVCMSKVATGKIAIMAKDGKPIPPDWMLDRNGPPTTDANEVYHGGVMLPFAEHKGYGFAVMVELLTGVLAMSGMMDEVKSWNKVPGRDSNTGHCFIAINPAFFGGIKLFKNRVDEMIDRLKACPPAPGVQEVLYPGELEERRITDALANGVPLPEASFAELSRAAEMTGVDLGF